jgi:hypothetical protein
VTGNLRGEFKISRSSAEGLINGIDNALSQVAADQADKVRACLKPVRDRLLDLWLPAPRHSSAFGTPAAPGKYLWVYKDVTIRCNIPIEHLPAGEDVKPFLAFALVPGVLSETILRFGEQDRVYECSVGAKGIDPTSDPHHAWPKGARALMEARFSEQGRKCGLIWYQLDWSFEGGTKTESKVYRKNCVDGNRVVVVPN